MGKWIVVGGLVIFGLGLLVWAGERLPVPFRPFHLPGDIRIERDGFRLYVPITTMLVLSLLATLVLWLVRWWRGP